LKKFSVRYIINAPAGFLIDMTGSLFSNLDKSIFVVDISLF